MMKEHERLILAQQINKEHRLCVATNRSCVEHAIYAGEMLVEAKGRTVRGGWGAWLEQNFDGSERIARAYMRAAHNREVIPGEKGTFRM